MGKLTTNDVAQRYGVSAARVRQWFSDGRLKAWKTTPDPGSAWYTTEAALKEFEEANPLYRPEEAAQ